MKVFSSDCTFDYSWEEVSTANWRKYCPWNDKSTHVVAVDTLSRRVDKDTGILRTERLITCQQSAPAWVTSLLGGSNRSHVHEISYVDPASKRVTMSSTNLTWSNVLSVRETVVYQPDYSTSPSKSTSFILPQASDSSDSSAPSSSLSTTPSSNSISSTSTPRSSLSMTSPQEPSRTIFRQEAQITALCGGWQRIRNRIEEASIERFGENARKGREGFEAVLAMSRRVFSEERERANMQAMA